MTAVIPELNQKLKMTQGDTASWIGQVKDPDDNYQPKDITGATMVWVAEDEDGTEIWRKTITLPVGNHSGMFTLGPLLAADTQGLPDVKLGLLFYVEMTLGGNVSVVSKGVIYVNPVD